MPNGGETRVCPQSGEADRAIAARNAPRPCCEAPGAPAGFVYGCRMTKHCACVLAGGLFWAPGAAADIATPGFKHVPLELTLTVADLPKTSALVVLGCNSENGRHMLGFAEAGRMLRCSTKFPAEVYVVEAAEAKALRALYDKDVGWGQEGMEARAIVEGKAKPCGKLSERTHLEEKLGIQKVVASYRVELAAAGCSLVKTDADAAAAPAAPSAAPSAPASTGAAPSTSAPTAAPKSGCAGCTSSGREHDDGLALALTGLAALAVRRRRGRSG